MENAQLREQIRLAELPAELTRNLEQFIRAVQVLAAVYPRGIRYQVEFAERCLLREALDPNRHNDHWWPTGLHIVRQGLADHVGARGEFDSALGQLQTALNERLGPYEEVCLREINADSVTGVCLLSELMRYPQSSFVAPNAYSLAQAMFAPSAWYRAVYAGKVPVGFIMLDDDVDKQEYSLWRFMIAPPFQGKGFGASAIALLVDYVKTRPGATELLLGYIDHEQGPGEFYRRLGFTETGEVEDGEVIMRLDLSER